MLEGLEGVSAAEDVAKVAVIWGADVEDRALDPGAVLLHRLLAGHLLQLLGVLLNLILHLVLLELAGLQLRLALLPLLHDVRKVLLRLQPHPL